MKCITETDIEVYFPNIEDDAIYDLECYDGYAIGKRVCDTDQAPMDIKMTYPTLAEVKANEELANYILKYRGLYDLTIDDIHYGDIMMALGEIE